MNEGPLLFTLVDITAHESHLRLWGRTKEGQSVCATTKSFYPYFYAQCESLDVGELEAKLGTAYRGPKPEDLFIRKVEVTRKIPIMGWQNGRSQQMYKITLGSPKYVSSCRQILEHTGTPTYEGSVLYTLRYLVDNGIGGNDWVRIAAYRRLYEPHIDSDIQVEFDSLERVTNEFSMGPFVWLAFDLEACRGGNGRGFVDASEDPISQIGCSLFDASYGVLDKRCFSLGDSVARCPENVEVELFRDEAHMLLAWARYVCQRNVDVFTGYNIDGFDWPYLFERAKVLGVLEDFTRLLSRDGDRKAYIKKSTFNSRAKGMRTDYEVTMEGRYSVDLMKMIKDAMKLRSYGLGSVAHEVLGLSKVEMDYRLIPVYQRGTPEQRAHLCYYCWYDAELCRKIMQARRIILNNAETARFAGVPFKFVVNKGQQVLSTSLILRYGNARSVVIPSFTENQNDEETKGATVQEALVGFYECWIVVLDFRSLYPSIIQDRNICYSTKISIKRAQGLGLEADRDYWVPPIEGCEYCFVASHIWKGILPEIEETLFGKRQDAKADLKAAKDPAVREVLDCRQNTIKLRMNALYGYLKANTLCDKDLMEAVTGEGRDMIRISKELAEREFPQTVVVYGDTDSIFIKFDGGRVPTKEEAFRLGYDCADRCTKIFTAGRKPVHLLQMEKAFDTLLLCGKKKYVGLMYLDDGEPPKIKSTGLETVRRDNARIASETMQACLDLIILERKKREAVALVRETILNLYLGRVPFHQLIISKNLSKSWKHYEEKKSSQPHVTLAKKIKARSHLTGEEEYHTGDRVKFIMVSGLKGSKNSDNAEDPLYALQNRLSIDYAYYVENQMMKPLLRIFTPILGPGETMKKRNKKGESVVKPDRELRMLRSYLELFTGPHMLQRVQRVKEGPGAVGIVAFARRLPTCIECNARVPHGHSLCDSCDRHKQRIYMRLMEQLQDYELERWRAWSKCQRCVGSTYKEVDSCKNKDCDNFYHREKVCIDIEDVANRLERIDF